MDELIKLLKELGLNEDDAIDKVVEMSKALVGAETEKGKKFYRDKDSEAKKLRENLKKLGYDTEQHGSVDEYLSAREKENSLKETTLESLKESVEALKNDLSGERELRTTEHNNRVKATATATLMEKLAPRIYGAKGTINGVIATSEIAMDGDNITIGGVGVDEFVEGYIKDNPEDIRVVQSGGSGIPPDDSGALDFDSMSTLDALASI